MSGRKARGVKAVEREIVMAELADERYVERLFTRGLQVFQALRSRNQTVVDAALEGYGKRAEYVTTKLPNGSKLELGLHSSRAALRVYNRAKNPVHSMVARPEAVACEIARRCRNEPEHVVRVAATIERARRRVLELTEEATRWM